MPKNLHAFMRYKLFDECFRNPNKSHWTISELQDFITEQLQKQNPNATVSERTLRADIRVMRGDTLGFNAPIKVRLGHYFYANRNYSIATALIPEKAIKMIEEFILYLWKLSSYKGIDPVIRIEIIDKIERMVQVLGNSLNVELAKIDSSDSLVFYSRVTTARISSSANYAFEEGLPIKFKTENTWVEDPSPKLNGIFTDDKRLNWGRIFSLFKFLQFKFP